MGPHLRTKWHFTGNFQRQWPFALLSELQLNPYHNWSWFLPSSLQSKYRVLSSFFFPLGNFPLDPKAGRKCTKWERNSVWCHEHYWRRSSSTKKVANRPYSFTWLNALNNISQGNAFDHCITPELLLKDTMHLLISLPSAHVIFNFLFWLFFHTCYKNRNILLPLSSEGKWGRKDTHMGSRQFYSFFCYCSVSVEGWPSILSVVTGTGL